MATYASLGELASMSYPPRALYDLSLRSPQGPNRRWPISLGSNARSTRVTQNSQLYDRYSPYGLSTQILQLISCRLAYCYWLASRICHRQPCLSSTYSRLNCLDSTELRPSALPPYAIVLGGNGFRCIHQCACEYCVTKV